MQTAQYIITLPDFPAHFSLYCDHRTREELSRELVEIANQIQVIRGPAEAESRDLTEDETQRIEQLLDQFAVTEARLETFKSRGRVCDPNPIQPQNKPGNRPRGRSTQHGGARFRDLASGEPIQAYAHGEHISPLSDRHDYAVGEIVRALALGDTGLIPSELRNAVTVGDDAGGGYLTSSALSSRFIDLARDASVCVRAGASSVQLQACEVRIGKLTADPTAHWRGETQSITASTPSFGSVIMRPKVCAVLIPLSLEWVEDSINGTQLIEQTVSTVIGAAIDKAALTGTGAAAEPLGLTNNGDVNSRSSVGTPSDYSAVSNAIGDILEAKYNGDIGALSWILPPAIATTYDQLTTGISGDATPLMPTGWVSQLRRFHTTALEGANSPLEYPMIVGNFSELLFGFRLGGIRLQTLQAGTATDSDGTSWNAVDQMMVFVRAYVRFDVAALRPDWFTHLSGVTR